MKRWNLGNVGDKKSLSSKEVQALLLNKKKPNRFRNKPVIIDGKKFQSTREGVVYQDLCWQKNQGIIYDFETQKKFPLLEACQGKERSYYAKHYIADFVIYNKDRDIIKVIDVKPLIVRKQKKRNNLSRTDRYKLATHLFFLKYGIEVTEI